MVAGSTRKQGTAKSMEIADISESLEIGNAINKLCRHSGSLYTC